jgi:hypothetical protein
MRDNFAKLSSVIAVALSGPLLAAFCVVGAGSAAAQRVRVTRPVGVPAANVRVPTNPVGVPVRHVTVSRGPVRAPIRLTPAEANEPLSTTSTSIPSDLNVGNAQPFIAQLLGGVAVINSTRESRTAMPTSGTQQNIGFSAAPTAGPAPLLVTFSATGFSPGAYTVFFGDGTNGQLDSELPYCPARTTPCTGPAFGSASHTYQSAGSYTATLTQSGLPLCAGCAAPILGTVIVTVALSGR